MEVGGVPSDPRPEVKDAKPEIKDAKPEVKDAKPEIKDVKAEPPKPMKEFYNHVVALTKRRNDPELLRKATDEVFQRIIEGHDRNIEIAAMNTRTSAFLFAYAPDAEYRGNIRLHDIIHPSEGAIQICLNNKIEPILDRLRNMFAPFEVHVSSVTDDAIEVTLNTISVSWHAE